MKVPRKQCFKCGEFLPRTEFYKHPQTKDGLLGKCKSCTKFDVRVRYLSEPEKIREYERKRSKLPHRRAAVEKYQSENPELFKEVKRRYRESHKEEISAQAKVRRAIILGRLARCPCEVCGTTDSVQAHHDDYSKPLDVRWLCPSHHGEHHSNTRVHVSGT